MRKILIGMVICTTLLATPPVANAASSSVASVEIVQTAKRWHGPYRNWLTCNFWRHQQPIWKNLGGCERRPSGSWWFPEY